ncbi:GGDEF domain-containing protein [Marinicella meishanensis]|uniref:GGDEF domain-containing protein n=1 Tax=Marinicella meishanensis TaxID=2873263 RepID=UPI001CBAC629|nr:GGDEF domain-containing protein [Marinicella sp. NBU2979]
MRTNPSMEIDLNTAIDVALNTWAVSVQLAILSVFTGVFLVLWWQFPRRDVFFWLLAWGANLVALLCIFAVLALVDHWPATGIKALYLLYAMAKIWFALLLVIGLGRHLNRLDLFSRRVIQYLLWATAAGWLALWLSPMNTLHIQIVVYWVVGSTLLLGGGLFLLQHNFHPGRWLQSVMMLEGLVFVHHGWVLLPTLWGGEVPAYMTRISFFDSISELIVGITCVLATTRRVLREEQNRNRELEQAQHALRELIDEDPLTGLHNRRKLHGMTLAPARSAVLVYLDIDRFKPINDQWGHAVGDACLRRLAESMQQHLNGHGELFRLGGDEFLAMLFDQDEPTVQAMIDRLRQDLAVADAKAPAFAVSVGVATWSPSESFEQALQQADAAMYQNKQR